jgi:small subunit ribosomal protein S17
MKTLQGSIISLKTLATATVLVERQWQHPIYKKLVKRTKKYACHYDSQLPVKVGTKVVIEECRPISKTKKFRIKEIVK